MKRPLLIVVVLLLLCGIGIAVWTVAGLPPVRMVWRYGFSCGPKPTGKREIFEGVEFVEIGPGCFRMGSQKNAEGGNFLGRWCARFGLLWGDQPEPSSEMPVHWVEFPRGFFIARHEVTNEQYEAFDPEHERTRWSPGNRDPVVRVSWEDARKYCAWLSRRSGQLMQLPAESEWECACRAGSDGDYCFGDNRKLLGRYAWYDANTDDRAQEVGTRRANAWGLFDFHGNVLEWCEDAWHSNYVGAPSEGAAWTKGGELPTWDDALGGPGAMPSDAASWKGTPCRTIRCGSYGNAAEDCQASRRYRVHPKEGLVTLGFRLAFRTSQD
jgi:formylglycine-generating enzyme required for sulfatase activity